MASEVRTNKISPASGVNLTLGDSGDTFTVPSGATLSNAGAITIPSGGSLTIDSGATVTNNGTQVGFGESNTDVLFSERKLNTSYYTGADNTWWKSPIGTAATGGQSVIEEDTVNGFDQTNSRWVCPAGYAGWYSVGSWYGWNDNGQGMGNARHAYYINGSPMQGLDIYAHISYPFANGAYTQQVPNIIVYLNEGDYLEWYYFLNWTSSSERRVINWRKFGYRLGA